MSTDGNSSFLREVRIRNFKSIGKCAVTFQPVTLLVGRNGSGKSNFLDALRFVNDGLQSSLDHAIRQRGGIDNVRRRSTGHPRNFAIELILSLPHAHVANYAFEIAARPNGGFAVKREDLAIQRHDGSRAAFFRREESSRRRRVTSKHASSFGGSTVSSERGGPARLSPGVRRAPERRFLQLESRNDEGAAESRCR